MAYDPDKDSKEIPQSLVDGFKEKRYEECILLCDEVLKKNPDNVEALLPKGQILQDWKRYKEAIDCYRTLVTNAPYFYYVWRSMAYCYMEIKDYDNGRLSFMEAIKATGRPERHAEDWCGIALCYALQDKVDVAYYALDSAYETVENKTLVLFTKGLIQERGGRDDDALFSYVQSQLVSADEDKVIGARKIAQLLTK